MTDTLLLLSGGIDSAYCLWQRVNAGLPTRVHHVHLADAEGRAAVESRAVRQVLAWLHTNYDAGRLIEYSESSVDFTDLWVPLNHHLWAYWAGAILAAPQGRDYRFVVVPRHSDAFHDGDVDGPAAQASDAAYLGHIELMAPGRVPTLTYPIKHLTKAEIVAAMPADLLACCWWCRRPEPGPKPCHDCYTCRLVDPALDATDPWATANPTYGQPRAFEVFARDYLNQWTEETDMQRVEIRIDDRIHYCKDVENVDLTHADGVLSLKAREPGAQAPLVPPPPSPGAPDGHDELPEGDDAQPQPAVIERVHTGEVYGELTEVKAPRGKRRSKVTDATAEASDLPPGAIDVTDAVFGDALDASQLTGSLVSSLIPAEDAGQAVHLPTGTVMDGVLSLDPGTVADLVTDTEIPVADDESAGE